MGAFEVKEKDKKKSVNLALQGMDWFVFVRKSIWNEVGDPSNTRILRVVNF